MPQRRRDEQRPPRSRGQRGDAGRHELAQAVGHRKRSAGLERGLLFDRTSDLEREPAPTAPGADTVQLGAGCLYRLTGVDNNWYGPNGLPAIASDITIEGNGATWAASTSATARWPRTVTLRLRTTRVSADGRFTVVVANANRFAVRAALSAATAKAVAVGRKRRRVTLKAKTVEVAPAAGKAVTLRLPATLRSLLRRQGKLSLRLQARLRDPAGNTRVVTKAVAPRAARAHRG